VGKYVRQIPVYGLIFVLGIVSLKSRAGEIATGEFRSPDHGVARLNAIFNAKKTCMQIGMPNWSDVKYVCTQSENGDLGLAWDCAALVVCKKE
jgi:hypothetical protein